VFVKTVRRVSAGPAAKARHAGAKETDGP